MLPGACDRSTPAQPPASGRRCRRLAPHLVESDDVNIDQQRRHRRKRDAPREQAEGQRHAGGRGEEVQRRDADRRADQRVRPREVPQRLGGAPRARAGARARAGLAIGGGDGAGGDAGAVDARVAQRERPPPAAVRARQPHDAAADDQRTHERGESHAEFGLRGADGKCSVRRLFKT
jgi:hypothetical protein